MIEKSIRNLNDENNENNENTHVLTQKLFYSFKKIECRIIFNLFIFPLLSLSIHCAFNINLSISNKSIDSNSFD